MADHEFKVGAFQYRAGRMSAFTALDIARKWSGPLMFLSTSSKVDFSAEDFARGMVLGSGGVAKDDNDAAVLSCLSCVQRRLDGDKGWAPLVNGNVLAYQDMDFSQVLQVCYGALIANRLMGPDSFFSDALASMKANPQAA